MELFFTAITLVLVGAVYLLVQRARSPSGLSRKPIMEWMSRFDAATPVEQYELAEGLLQQSALLAEQMDVDICLHELLPADGDPIALVMSWQAQLTIAIPAHALLNTPARTIGALMLIREVQPDSFRQLLGQAITR